MIHIKDMWKEQEITRLRETIEAIFRSLIQTPPEHLYSLIKKQEF